MIQQNNVLDARETALHAWICGQFNQKNLSWQPLSGDAGTRRYYKVHQDGKAYLAVDSPPDSVDNPRFIAIAQGLSQAGLHVPTLFAAELNQGFLLINELSEHMYTDVLTEQNAQALYTDALQALLQLQDSLPYYAVAITPWDEANYYEEMTDMNIWLLERHLGIHLSSSQLKSLQDLFKMLLENLQVQPHVCVHRDYHGRNLLYCLDHNPGIIDFQDMIIGPITYDLVSLVRDAYVKWPWDYVQNWISQFYQLRVEHQGKVVHRNFGEEQFTAWFHGMSLQRGLKVLGRFPRLCYRDHKPQYLADLPLVAHNVLESCPYFSGTAVLEDLLNEQILPLLKNENTKCMP